MKSFCGLLVALVLLGWAITRLGGCATGPNPCIGPASARPLMPCTCPGSTNPGCYPFPQDAKKPDGGSSK